MFGLESINGFKEQLLFLSRHNVFLEREIRRIKEHEHLTEAEHTRLKEIKAFEMARFAKKHSAYFNKRYQSIPLIQQQEFASLPVITKKDILENRRAISTTSPVFLKEGLTSGTSGTPLRIYRSPGSIIRENAYLWYFRMMHGWNIGDPVVSMRGKLDGSTLSYYNKAENVLYISCYLLSPGNIRKYAKVIRDFQPKAIASLPSSLYTMVNLLNQEGVELHIPKAFTASSTLYPFQREKIESTLQAKLFDWYGNAERTITLGQCSHGNYHEFPMYSLNDFQKNGVITTALTNKSFPLIKYFVEDNFTLLDGPCACGKEKGIRSIEGRFEDAVVLGDGSIVNGLGIAFQGINHLQYAQIIQEQVNRITVNLVKENGFSKQDENLILRRLVTRMNDTVEIDFQYVHEDDIIKTPAGKFTLIISRLNVARLPDHLRTFDKQAAAIAS
jgi:phenylacetate-CoA ligase